MIERNDSMQTTCNATATVNGEKRQVASATCTIRPGRGFTFTVDLVPGPDLTLDDKAEIADMYASFLEGQISKAAALGIPVALPAAQ